MDYEDFLKKIVENKMKTTLLGSFVESVTLVDKMLEDNEIYFDVVMKGYSYPSTKYTVMIDEDGVIAIWKINDEVKFPCIRL